MSQNPTLRQALEHGDEAILRDLMAADPSITDTVFEWGGDRPSGPCRPLTYLAQLRFNGFLRAGTSGRTARQLIAARAPIDGGKEDRETPLITAASYHDIGVVEALLEAGADLERTGYAVAGGTAVAHAVEFGNTEIVDILVAAGAKLHTLSEHAGAGNIAGKLSPTPPQAELLAALRAAALNDRLDVIDQLLTAGATIDGIVQDATSLHWAAWQGKTAAVRHLVEKGARTDIPDPNFNSTAFGWAQHRRGQGFNPQPDGFDGVIEFLRTCSS